MVLLMSLLLLALWSRVLLSRQWLICLISCLLLFLQLFRRATF
jgi:hypothetical protein